MKYLIVALISALFTYLLIDYLSKNKPKLKDVNKDLLIELAKTNQAKELILSDEFYNLVKTNEFKNLAENVGTSFLNSLFGFK